MVQGDGGEERSDLKGSPQGKKKTRSWKNRESWLARERGAADRMEDELEMDPS